MSDMSDGVDKTHLRDRPLRERRTQNITARELSRETAILLDEVERRKSVFNVVRHGRLVASLGPVGAGGSDRSRSEIEIPELSELQKEIMEQMREQNPRAFFSDASGTPGEIALAVTKLEIAGLIRKQFGGSYALNLEGSDYLRATETKG